MITVTPADRQRLARAAGMNEQYLYQCLTGRRETPVDRCAPLEALAAELGIAGVTRHTLRPGDWWVHWPELATAVRDFSAGAVTLEEMLPGAVPASEPGLQPGPRHPVPPAAVAAVQPTGLA